MVCGLGFVSGYAFGDRGSCPGIPGNFGGHSLLSACWQLPFLAWSMLEAHRASCTDAWTEQSRKHGGVALDTLAWPNQRWISMKGGQGAEQHIGVLKQLACRSCLTAAVIQLHKP